MSDPAAPYKKRAAEAALEQVESHMVIGLGTGSTAAFVISGLAERLESGSLQGVRAVPTSEKTAQLAASAGIPLTGLEPMGIDLAIDGCDEVDAELRAIKGLGGALTREKLVAREARRFLIVADESKFVARLGERTPVPIEVLAFGLSATMARLEALGGECILRLSADSEPVLTDNGNFVVDFAAPVGFEPAALGPELKAVTGVVEHGLFLDLASEAIFAGPDGERVVTRA